MGSSRRARRSCVRALAYLLGLVACGSDSAAGAAPTPWPAPIASYTIDVRYDADEQTVAGKETLRWHNTTSGSAEELQFHLYLNAFANNRSTFIRGEGVDWVDWAEEDDNPWGYTEVTSIRIGANELLERARFIQPDDGNADDRTVLALELPEPVAAGATVEIEIDFTSKLPRALARSGYAGPYAFVAQWFPKIGVFEEDGTWNCHQYHRTTEFYADFGTYDVSITVPAGSIVGATGSLVEDNEHADGTRRLRFRAEGVHDFAWVVDPRFEVVERQIEGVSTRLLVQPAHRSQAERYLQALRAGIEHYERWIGRYPYASLTLVDPGPGGRATAGMEYPTLITLGTAWWMPDTLRIPEVVTVHEFGHQYWYGIVANNEFEHAWLDEGINSYLEGKIMDATYGAASYLDLFGLQVDSVADWRSAYLRAPSYDAIVRPAWQFVDDRSYGAVTYAKTALALDTLDRHSGNGAVLRGLAAYFTESRFRHPKPAELLASLALQIDTDLSPYVGQVFYGTGVVDYAVTRVESHSFGERKGYPLQDTSPGDAVAADADEEKHVGQYRNQIVVERLGEVVLPVRVEVQFNDGTTASEVWDGAARWKRFDYTGTQRVDWAVIDPDGKITLDVNRLNNSRMRQAGTRGIVRLATRWGFWFQSLLHVLAGL